MYSGCRVIGSRGWAELTGWLKRKEGGRETETKRRRGESRQRAREYRRRWRGKQMSKKKWRKREKRERLQTILRWCSATGAASPSTLVFFVSFFSRHLFSHHSPCVAPCPCLWALHQVGLQVHWTNPSPPSLPPWRTPVTLIRWCRFTATGRPGEPLVSSLQFQNVLLNVLLFFPLVFLLLLLLLLSSCLSHVPQAAAFPYSCCCLFTWSLTRFLQISDVAAWIILGEGLARHLTQTVRKTRKEKQLHPAYWDQTPFLEQHIVCCCSHLVLRSR